MTPSVKDQPIEEGRARVNNAGRFRKKREGLYIVLEPIQDEETRERESLYVLDPIKKDAGAYLKIENHDDDKGDEVRMHGS